MVENNGRLVSEPLKHCIFSKEEFPFICHTYEPGAYNKIYIQKFIDYYMYIRLINRIRAFISENAIHEMRS